MRYSVKKYAEALYEATKGRRASEQEKLVVEFFRLLDRYHDRSLLPRIIEQYEKLRRKKEGVAKVEITMTKKVSAKIKSEIEKKVGKAEIVEKVQPEILGGMKLIINEEYLIDGTFQGRVEKLYQALLRAQ